MKILQWLKKTSRSRKERAYQARLKVIDYDLVVAKNKHLGDVIQKLKTANKAILDADETQIKHDLNEAINIIIDYQRTLGRVKSPDPNIQRANLFLNKWGIQSERSGFQIWVGNKEISQGVEF